MDTSENIYLKAINKFTEHDKRVLKGNDLHAIAAVYAEYYNAESLEDGNASEVLRTQVELIKSRIVSAVMENENYYRTNATCFDKWEKLD